MDFTTLKNSAAVRFRDPGKLVVDDTRWGEYVNAAYNEFYQVVRWPSRLTNTDIALAAGEHIVTLTADQMAFLSDVYDSTAKRPLYLWPLVQDDPEGWNTRQRLWLETQDSEPIFYSISGLDLFVFPASATIAHTIRVRHYQTDPVNLSAGGDVPAIPTRFHEALVDGALYRAYLDDGDATGAEGLRNSYMNFVAQASRELEPKGLLTMDLDSLKALVGQSAGK